MTKPKQRTGKARPERASAPSKSKRLEISALDGMTENRLMAEVAASPAVTSATVLTEFSKGHFGELSLTDAADALKEKIQAVQGGNLTDAEAMLTGQAFALNTIFTELARRSALNMGQYLNASERYMRLALKAQSQCRTTLETLAALRNPPVVIAKQANVTSGPQQINNGVAGQPRAGETGSAPNKLLEAEDGQWLDTGTPGAASGADTHMATVGAIDRTANGRR
ncbi:MAG: hypothetical protein KDJ47_18040 [Hyphomicrobiaceae bacterium]|nr:hypothetical protein [Hyphomicrobiaceae bacterium]